ncbi:MAG: cupin domain-containing protein [Brevundimonas sp.]|uniref:cupin domain-containing protein n=1 Tax=Brevundimonas sp. TaxID=1871086 RepID=UPI00271BF9CF|nr:cupin domain-containing protein [Brevundimonas sp.]MDO9589407.1 cupin domain-containing protein [Brevundimonas sp.]
MRRFHGPSRLSGIAAALALTACLGAIDRPLAAEPDHHKVVPAGEVTFGAGPPFLPPGVEMVVLAGNPGVAGVFVLRLKFPAGYVIPPHIHSQDELVTVISGQLGVAMGDTLDRDAAHPLAPGSFVQLPANMSHYAWADEETVVQLAGMGPFDITYIDDADDPRINESD